MLRTTRTFLNKSKLGNLFLHGRNFFTFIENSQTGIKQTFGKATGLLTNNAVLGPGFHLYVPGIQCITKVSNRLRQTEFEIEIKTHDNVFARLKVSVQWSIETHNIHKAFFSLDLPIEQIRSYVENVLRSRATKSTLDELFSVQYEIAENVKHILSDVMNKHGYTISDTLITDINPSGGVKNSMNEINRTERLKIASQNEADAYYIRSVREAEADAERKRLQGEGISQQRQTIMKGYHDNIDKIYRDLGLSSQELLGFMERMQRWDTYSELAKSNNTKVLIIPEENQKTQSYITALEAHQDDTEKR